MPSALVVVPPFLKMVTGPLLGPAMLLGAARRAGHEARLLDLNATWLGERLPRWPELGPPAFVGDHDRPSTELRVLQRRWSELCGACFAGEPDGELAEDPWLTLTCGHEAVLDAARRMAEGPVGDWIRNELLGPPPAVLGVSVMYSGQVLAALAVALLARRSWPDVLVVFGGAHVTALRTAIVRDATYGAFVDRFVFGYAERTWVDLLDAVEDRRELPRAAVVAGSGVDTSADDDASVMPAFDVALLGGRLTLPIQASRGCAYGRCTFCTYPAVEGAYRPLDLGPVDQVVARAQELGAAVSFKDSLVLPARLDAIAERIGGRVRWAACTKLHPRLDAAFLRRLAAGGCVTLEVGLETLTQSGQLVIDKRQSLPLFLSVLDAAAEARISLVVNYITGFPGTDPVEEGAWLARVRAEIAARPSLVAKVEHNTFQLERMSPMGRAPAAFGLEVTRTWPWATVLAWRQVAVPVRRAG